jgi:hypothetical protein
MTQPIPAIDSKRNWRLSFNHASKSVSPKSVSSSADSLVVPWTEISTDYVGHAVEKLVNTFGVNESIHRSLTLNRSEANIDLVD